MKTKILTLFIFLSISFISAPSQQISGIISGPDKLPVPFATIYIQQLKTGTACNEKGKYEIKLGLGTYDLEFRALGYQLKKIQVEIGTENKNLDIQLEEQVYNINEIVVKKGNEDPAYGMMRKAISLSPYYQSYIGKYKANYYVKLNGHLIYLPNYAKTLMSLDKEAPKVKTGDVFVLESVNELSFTAPNKYFQKVISFKSTFPKDNNPRPIVISGSFYDLKFWGGISPLATNAFSYYKFRYEGVTLEKGYSVLKIRVIPKFKGTNLFDGLIYLVDQTYNIYSIDLNIPNEIGRTYIKQQYGQVNEKSWLPISFSTYQDFKIFGIKASFSGAISIKYSDIEINQKLKAPEWLRNKIEYNGKPAILEKDAEQILSKKQKKINELMSKENLSKSDMLKLAALMKKQAEEQDTIKRDKLQVNNNISFSIEKNALTADSNFWNQSRPIPLTTAEVKSIQIMDSMTIKPRQDTSKKDSLKPVKRNWPKVYPSQIIMGNRWRDTLFNEVNFSGIINPGNFWFNPADGFAYSMDAKYSQFIDSTQKVMFEPAVAYAFNRKAVYYKGSVNWQYAPLKMALLTFDGGHWSNDFKNENGVNRFMNSFACLLFHKNYMKIYDSKYLSMSHHIELTNGLMLHSKVIFENRQEFSNNTNYSFFKKNSQYDTNTPNNVNYTPFSQDYRAFNMDVNLEYTPLMHYGIWKRHFKYYAGSDFPTFNIRLIKGFPEIFKSKSDFLFLATGINQQIRYGISSKFWYSIKAGSFLSSKNLHFTDFYHPTVQEIPVILNSQSDYFSLLHYYESSTNKRFIEAHLRLSSPYIALKFLPLLNLTNLKEEISLSALSTPANSKYVEVGYGIYNLPLSGKLSYVAGFDMRGKILQGIKFSFRFNNEIVIGGND